MEEGARFRGVRFRLRDHDVREFGEGELASALADPETFAWVDLQAPGGAGCLPYLDRLGVDRAVAERLDSPEILPWIVERPNCVAFRLFEIDHPEAHRDTSKRLHEMRATTLLVVLGRNFVFTWHPRPLDAVDEIGRTCGESFRLAGRTPGFIAFLLLQRCLYDYADLNLANDNFLDGLEPSVAGAPRPGLARDIGVAGANILHLKKLATSLHIVCMLFATKRTPFVSDEARASFRDLQENALSVRSAVDSSRDLLDGVVGAMQAEAAGRTSEIAAVLTIVSVIMLPLGLIAGVWGMNFDRLPLVKREHGFWLLLGTMAVIAVALALLFRRIGWIRPRQRPGTEPGPRGR